MCDKEKREREIEIERGRGGECDDKCNVHFSGDLEIETRTDYERQYCNALFLIRD